MVKAIFFDFDGVIHNTLIDLHKVHTRTLENISLLELKKKVFEGNPREYFDKFSKTQKENFEREWQKHYNSLIINSDIKDMLITLAKTYQLFIISSNNENNLIDYLKKNKISELFDGVLGSETSKYKTVKFKKIFHKFNLDSNECIFITDTLGDLLEANEVNLKTICVNFGYHDENTLKKGNPFKIISSFNELFEILDKI